jgi:hypothetical protein
LNFTYIATNDSDTTCKLLFSIFAVVWLHNMQGLIGIMHARTNRCTLMANDQVSYTAVIILLWLIPCRSPFSFGSRYDDCGSYRKSSGLDTDYICKLSRWTVHNCCVRPWRVCSSYNKTTILDYLHFIFLMSRIARLSSRVDIYHFGQVISYTLPYAFCLLCPRKISCW